MPLLIGIFGDGGWKGLVENMAASFSENDVPVVGIDALKYFWNYVSPEKCADDMAKIIESYLIKWHKSNVVLMDIHLELSYVIYYQSITRQN
jgi:type IV secretory pathway VirJ component